ncbi:bZIP transcription factor [Dictyocaulus viviparus]|uniref:X-box-binding protein 1 n=1 Tax=Dictyocaulus viviparus TaxID=29172 RepID=A0A0D8XY12_DICVI|nr:bZIP transcription factor [Dictyocaulus viviparus]
MPSHRTFYLVPVTQSTVAAPRSLAPSPCIVPTVSVVTKPANASKRPLSADPIEVLLGEQPQPHQRKRECLDHLTHEQKLNRRKMKNRIAAQTARDRKKYRSQRLEDVIRELLEQNEALKQENDQLRIANQELSEKNKSLVASLYSNEEVTCRVESNKEIICDVYNEMMPDDSETAVESAAFISEPLPRVQVVSLCLLFHLMINIMLAVVFSSRTSSKRYSMSFPTRYNWWHF